MNVLAIDTATEILSVAVATNARAEIATNRASGGGFELFAVTQDAGLKHSERLLSLVDLLLRQAGIGPADIDLVAVSLGPGSFTGLRIGLATAKGLAAANGTAIVQVDTFAVYGSLHAHLDVVSLPVIDAKKRRFYAAAYRGGEMVFDTADLSPEEALSRLAGRGPIVVTGPHARQFADRVSAVLSIDRDCRRGMAPAMVSRAISELDAHGPAPHDCVPRYVRLSDAELSIAREKR